MNQKRNIFIQLSFSVLCLVGALLSYYTLEVYVKDKLGMNANIGVCNLSGSFDCGKVSGSEWGKILGQPLGAVGLFFYFSMLALVIQRVWTKFFSDKFVFSVLFFLTAAASTLSVVLFYVSKFVIGALCPLCIGLYLVNFALLILSVLGLKNSSGQKILPSLFSGIKELSDNLRSRRNRTFIECLLIILAVCLIGLWSIFVPKPMEQKYATQIESWPDPSESDFSLKLNLDGSPWGDYYLGNPKAKIQIVEFADFECPMCRFLGTKLKEWLEPYQGKYYFVFLNYPLDNACNPNIKRAFHQSACYLASTVRCAGEQGKFWEAYDYLNHLSDEKFKTNAISFRQELMMDLQGLGLDTDAIAECIESKRYKDKIQSDIGLGDSVGVTGTPTVVINGQLVKNLSKQAIDNIMAELLK